jgi:hypothetical protein
MAASPESITTKRAMWHDPATATLSVFMDSGLAPLARPGMTAESSAL